MSPEQFALLLSYFDGKIKTATNISSMKALDYVRSNDPVDRAASQQYNHEADLWQEAKRLAFDAKANTK